MVVSDLLYSKCMGSSADRPLRCRMGICSRAMRFLTSRLGRLVASGSVSDSVCTGPTFIPTRFSSSRMCASSFRGTRARVTSFCRRKRFLRTLAFAASWLRSTPCAMLLAYSAKVATPERGISLYVISPPSRDGGARCCRGVEWGEQWRGGEDEEGRSDVEHPHRGEGGDLPREHVPCLAELLEVPPAAGHGHFGVVLDELDKALVGTVHDVVHHLELLRGEGGRGDDPRRHIDEEHEVVLTHPVPRRLVLPCLLPCELRHDPVNKGITQLRADGVELRLKAANSGLGTLCGMPSFTEVVTNEGRQQLDLFTHHAVVSLLELLEGCGGTAGRAAATTAPPPPPRDTPWSLEYESTTLSQKAFASPSEASREEGSRARAWSSTPSCRPAPSPFEARYPFTLPIPKLPGIFWLISFETALFAYFPSPL
eukprot:Sspe_Gene.1413::Locus_470_Transcript_1_1_Confidence_1.000_Length_11716::g.1413::m.1413